MLRASGDELILPSDPGERRGSTRLAPRRCRGQGGRYPAGLVAQEIASRVGGHQVYRRGRVVGPRGVGCEPSVIARSPHDGHWATQRIRLRSVALTQPEIGADHGLEQIKKGFVIDELAT